MKFTRCFRKYLALFLIILLTVQNAFVISSSIASNNKSFEKRNQSLNRKKSTSSKNKFGFLVFGIFMGLACSLFSCSRVDKDSSKKILNESVERKEALIAKIIKESNYFEKNLKDFTLYKISYFLGVLPPQLLQEPYSSVIEQYAHCFIEQESANEKKLSKAKAAQSYKKTIILRRFFRKLKRRVSLAKTLKDKKNLSQRAARISSRELLRVRRNLIKLDKEAKDKQNLPLVRFLSRASLLFPNKQANKIPADARMLTFTKSNDEYIAEMKSTLKQISECKSDKLEKHLLKFNQKLLQEIRDEFSFLNTGKNQNLTESPKSDNKSAKNVIEYTKDPAVLKETSKGRLIAISETLDLIAEQTGKWKNVSQKASETIKNLKEVAHMIKDTKDFAKNSELIKDFEVVKNFVQKLDSWKFTKDEKLDQIVKVLVKYESKITPVAKAIGKVYKFSKTSSEIIKNINDLSLEDRPSVTIYKTLILGANISSILPGVSSQKFAIDVANYTAEVIRDSEKVQKIIDDSVTKSTQEYERAITKGFLPYQAILSNDFAMDSDFSDGYTNDIAVQEIKEIVNSLGESAKTFVEPIVKEMESDRSKDQIDRYTVISGDDFASDVVSYERNNADFEKKASSTFTGWFSNDFKSDYDFNDVPGDSFGNESFSSFDFGGSSDAKDSESNSGSTGVSTADSSFDSDSKDEETYYEMGNPFLNKKKKKI